MSRNPGAGYRHARLQELLHEELNILLRNEIADPDLHDLVFTTVELSVDYRNARVRWAIAGNSSPDAAVRRRVERALSRASAFLRGQLAFALDGKFVPQLRFSYDAAGVVRSAV